MSLAAAALLGLGFGVRHAIEADHLAAVCTFVARDASVTRAARAGALWGSGHAAALVVAGGAIVVTGVQVPESVAVGLELAVAVMLVGLGVTALLARPASTSEPEARRRRPFAVGLLHGASGTAALTLLVAATLPGRAEALTFLGVSAVGSVLGMAAVAAVIAWPIHRVAARRPALAKGARAAAGLASIIAGAALAWATLSMPAAAS